LGVTVRENKEGKSFYNLTENPDTLYAKRQEKVKASEVAKISARSQKP